MTSDQIACRHVQPDGWNCGAEAGEPCTTFDGLTRLQFYGYHLERMTDAAIAGEPSTPINETDYDAAVEKAVSKMLG